MTTQHAKSNAREGDGVADHLAVLDRLRKALPTVGLNGWFVGVKALDWAITELTAMQAQQGAEPVAWQHRHRRTNHEWGPWFDCAKAYFDLYAETPCDNLYQVRALVPATGAPR